MRDLINRAVSVGAQELPDANIYASTTKFEVKDQWCLVQSLIAPSPNGISLRASDGRLLIVNGPFFVAGAQSFGFLQTGNYLVTRANRRELLSPLAQLGEGVRDGAGYSEAFLQEGGAIVNNLAATDWAYLDANMEWATDTIGSLGGGVPFGWLATDPDVRGRYYDVEACVTSSVGSVALHIVHLFDTDVVASQVTGGGAANPATGLVRLGDVHTASEGVGTFSQRAMLTSGKWTLAITNNVLANLTGTVRVVRQGF